MFLKNKYIQNDRTYDRDRDRDRDRIKELEYILKKKTEEHKEDKVDYKLVIAKFKDHIKQVKEETQNLRQQLQEKNMIIHHIIRQLQIPQYQTSYNSQPSPLIYK